jgi:hypothetical protein
MIHRLNLAAGFTIGHLHQVEEKLSSPSAGDTTVCVKLKEGSSSKEKQDSKGASCRNKVKPWNGPLPPPRQSPLRTIGDAIANVRVETRKKSSPLYATRDHHQGFFPSQSSPTRRAPSLVGNLRRGPSV